MTGAVVGEVGRSVGRGFGVGDGDGVLLAGADRTTVSVDPCAVDGKSRGLGTKRFEKEGGTPAPHARSR